MALWQHCGCTILRFTLHYLERREQKEKKKKKKEREMLLSRTGIGNPVKSSPVLAFVIKFCWSKAMFIPLYLVNDAFLLEWQSWVVAIEILWTTEPKIFTFWSFLETSANPCSRKLILWLHNWPKVKWLVKSRTGPRMQDLSPSVCFVLHHTMLSCCN